MLERLDRFFEEYPNASRLKYGLRYVSHQLWDEILGWAITRGRWDDADLQAIDAYLFGGTIFRYATIFGASFSRTRSWRRSRPAYATSPSRYRQSCSRPGRSTRP